MKRSLLLITLILLLMFAVSSVLAQDGRRIVISTVTNSYVDGGGNHALEPGNTHRFEFIYQILNPPAGCEAVTYAPNNGFVVTSDGANLGSWKVTATDALKNAPLANGYPCAFLQAKANHFEDPVGSGAVSTLDGVSPDYFALFAVPNTFCGDAAISGMGTGFDTVAFWFEINTQLADAGKTVCIDTSSLGKVNTFTWAGISATQCGIAPPIFDESQPGFERNNLAGEEFCWTIKVPGSNAAPVLDPIGAKSTDENVNLNFGVSASDGDGDALTLTTSPLPTGANFTDNGDGTGTFDWTPGYDQSGSYDITFTVSDGTDTDDEIVTITVNNINRAPVLDPIGAKSTDEMVNLTFGVSASDPDNDGLTLTATGLPTGANFTDNGDGTGSFNWKPTYEQAGSYDVTFAVSDGTDSDDEVVTITVNNVNRAPLLTTPGVAQTNEGQNLPFGVAASDPDGDSVWFSATGIPSGATFTDNNDGTGSFDWTPNFDQAGVYEVIFTVTDGTDDDVDTVTITVHNVNHPPVLAAIGPKATAEETNLNFGVSASDDDGDALTLTASPLPDGANFTDNGDGTGMFDWTPAVGQAGSYDVTFTVFDGIDEDNEVVTITVGAGNALVVSPAELNFSASVANPVVDPQDFYVDATGDPLTFTLSKGADEIILSKVSGTTSDTITVSLDLTGMTPGTYIDTIWVTSLDAVNSPQFIVATLELAGCPSLVLDDLTPGQYEFAVFAGESVSFDDSVNVMSSTAETIPFGSLSTDYFTVLDSLFMTPSWFPFSFNRTYATAGTYDDTLTIAAIDFDPCGSSVTVVVTTTVFPPPSADTVLVANVPAVPGATVAVPVTFANSCTLNEAMLALAYDETWLHIDSVSFAGGVLGDWTNSADLGTDGLIVINSMVNGGTPLAPGTGNLWAEMYVTADCETPADVYSFLFPGFVDPPVSFTRDCGDGLGVEYPEYIPGSLVVDTSANYICGWVVDPDGTEIPGATVELHADFPFSTAMQTTTTSGIGSFAFSDFTTIPFDLYAYADGYYSELVQDLNFGDKGVKIVLTPIEQLTTTSQWVDYYCNNITYMGAPVPPGVVVEARNPQGLLVGQFTMTEAGKYGFMPVYRASDVFSDDGAHTGDIISFFLNGEEALATGDVIYPAEYAQVQVCLEFGASVTKECVLSEGWNLVSWNVNTESDAILDVLGAYMDCIDVVLGFEKGGLTYDPDLPEFSTLWYTDHLSGYWIKVKTGCQVTLAIDGLPVLNSLPIPVYTGWNLVSYLPEGPMAPVDGFASLDPNLLYAYGWNGAIEIYQPGANGFNTLTELATCNGYWVKMSAAAELIYGSPGVSVPYTGNPQAIAAKAIPGLEATPNWVNLYASNLKLDDNTVEEGTVITAHAAKTGELVGQFEMTENGKFGFMPVYASVGEGAKLQQGEEFYLAVDGVETLERFTWNSNGDRIEVGSLVSASLGGGDNLPEEYALAQNYPNPFNPTTTISFSLPNAGQTRIEIFNILGELVAVPFDADAEAGEHSVDWDGHSFGGQTVASGVYFYRLSSGDYSETRKMMLLK